MSCETVVEVSPSVKQQTIDYMRTEEFHEELSQASEDFGMSTESLVELVAHRQQAIANMHQIKAQIDAVQEDPAHNTELMVPKHKRHLPVSGHFKARHVDPKLPTITLEDLILQAKTGDLILFSGEGPRSNLIKIGTASPYSHIGIVYKGKLPCGEQLEKPALFQSHHLPTFDLRE